MSASTPSPVGGAFRGCPRAVAERVSLVVSELWAPGGADETPGGGVLVGGPGLLRSRGWNPGDPLGEATFPRGFCLRAQPGAVLGLAAWTAPTLRSAPPPLSRRCLLLGRCPRGGANVVL